MEAKYQIMVLTKWHSLKRYILAQMLSKPHFCLGFIKQNVVS